MNVRLFLALMMLMGITRIHHFGDTFLLPDASLAVFFLAGLFGYHRYLLLGLFVEAGLLDYIAIHYLDVSDVCLSAAYVFLVPTYAVMWFFGRQCYQFRDHVTIAFILFLAAVTGAFLISNFSFYWLSDQISSDLITYSLAISHYFIPYSGYTLFYILITLGTIKAVRMITSWGQSTQQ
jgi:hypothetical protein